MQVYLLSIVVEADGGNLEVGIQIVHGLALTPKKLRLKKIQGDYFNFKDIQKKYKEL